MDGLYSDSIDFSLGAWLPSPGFPWLYGEDEPGVYLPWLGMRKSWLVAVFPFARRLASGVICVGVLLVLLRAARWRRSSGRCLKQPRNKRVPNPEPRPEPEGGELPRVFGTEEEKNDKVMYRSPAVQNTWTVIPSPIRPDNRRGEMDVEESGRRGFQEEEEEDAVNGSTDGDTTFAEPAAVAHNVDLEVQIQEGEVTESSEFCLIFQPDSDEEDSAEESDGDQEQDQEQEEKDRTGTALDVNTDSDSEIVVSKTTVKVL